MARDHRAAALPADDFQRAVAAAAAESGERAWFELTPSERTQAIYAQLRRIDLERAASMSLIPKRADRFQVAGEPSKRTAAF